MPRIHSHTAPHGAPTRDGARSPAGTVRAAFTTATAALSRPPDCSASPGGHLFRGPRGRLMGRGRPGR